MISAFIISVGGRLFVFNILTRGRANSPGFTSVSSLLTNDPFTFCHQSNFKNKKKIKLKIRSIQISPFQKLEHSGDVTTSLSQSVFLLLVATWIAKFAVQRQLKKAVKKLDCINAMNCTYGKMITNQVQLILTTILGTYILQLIYIASSYS